MLFKNIRKGLLLVTLLPLTGAIVPSEKLFFRYLEKYYGPFDGSEGAVQMNLGYEFIGISSRHVKETLLLRDRSGMLVYRESSFEHTLASAKTYSYTFNVPTTTLPRDPELNLFYSISDTQTLETLVTKQIVVNRKNKRTIVTENNDITTYEYPNSFFSLSGSESNLYGFSETIKLANLSSYFVGNTYYEFDLSNQAFSYVAPVDFKYKSATLSFYDNDNSFPYMNKDSSTKEVSISLELVRKGKAVTMRIMRNKYRFHPRTYEMTDKNLEGYEPTNRFYLPLGKMNLLEGLECTLSLNGIGGNEVTILHKITFSSSNTLFGDCSNSDYCVSGGMAND